MARFGSIGTQYFDNSGEVLAGGLLYFFESGSTTAKTTYSDADQTVANTHPVVLDAAGRQPNIFFNGSAKVELRDSSGVLIQSVDPVGGSVTRDAFADWNALITYQVEDIVQGSDDKYYQSVANDNLGNDPTDGTTYWQNIRFIAEWNAGYTYTGGALVTGSDDALYQCVVVTSLGDDPTTSADWTKVGSSGWSSLVEDLTPQLGGNLDLNGKTVGAATAADLTKLNGVTATAAELNKMDGVTVTAVEINRLGGVSANIQTQLDGKQATLVSGTNIKTVGGTSILGSGDIPVSGGMTYPGAGIPVSTGSAWGASLTAPAGSLVGTTATQTLSNKTLSAPVVSGALTLPGNWTLVVNGGHLEFRYNGTAVFEIQTTGATTQSGQATWQYTP